MRYATVEQGNRETGEFILILDAKEAHALSAAVAEAAATRPRMATWKRLAKMLEDLPCWGGPERPSDFAAQKRP